MSPNKKSEWVWVQAPAATAGAADQQVNSKRKESKEQPKKEILYDGEYYDVTSWAKKHPGGSIINYYTAEGEDATHAIQQFHHRSSKQVLAIMTSLKKRPAGPSDSLLSAKDQALSADFTKLYRELEKEGMFEPSYTHLAYRFAEIGLMFWLGYQLFLAGNILTQFLGVILLGLAQGRCGWLEHELGHRSTTGNAKLDKNIHDVFMGTTLGLSSTWWIRGHNRHHAMPQRLSHDIDLETLPLMTYNAKTVKNSSQGKTFFVQNQMYLFLLLDTLLGVLIWKFYMQPKYVIKQGLHLQLACMIGHYAIFAYFVGFWPWLGSVWVLANYMFLNFALSHSHLPVTADPTHWVEYSLLHTANVTPSFWCDWWMGYLNYQIEHHLFPTMPQFRHRQIHGRVRAMAVGHGIPYHVYSYWEACQKTFANLRNVAAELRDQ